MRRLVRLPSPLNSSRQNGRDAPAFAPRSGFAIRQSTRERVKATKGESSMYSAQSGPGDERPRRRAGRTAASAVIAAVLAACGAGSEDQGGTNDPASSGGTTTVTTPAACTTAPASWSAVWTSMKSSCTACHVQGGVASGTGLVLMPAGTEIQNYNIVRDFAKVSGSLLLSKTVGQPSHAGGAPFVNTSSQQYQNLSGLITEAVAQVCVTTT